MKETSPNAVCAQMLTLQPGGSAVIQVNHDGSKVESVSLSENGELFYHTTTTTKDDKLCIDEAAFPAADIYRMCERDRMPETDNRRERRLSLRLGR